MATVNYSRRGWLKGKSTQDSAPPLRPPWSLSENQFLDVCERCDKCISACKEDVLFKGNGGFPEIKFDQGECTFCGDCAKACPSLAIDPSANEKPWDYFAEVQDTCFNKKGIVCQSCKDVCDAKAIYLVWTSAIPTPVIQQQDCTACGACVTVCPPAAISIKSLTNSR